MTKPSWVYKYYQILVRKKEVVTPQLLEGMRRAIWSFLEDTPMKDIHARKINKPQKLSWVGC